MNFELTEEQILIRETAKEFTNTHLLPGVIERDEDQRFPKEQIKNKQRTGGLIYQGLVFWIRMLLLRVIAGIAWMNLVG